MKYLSVISVICFTLSAFQTVEDRIARQNQAIQIFQETKINLQSIISIFDAQPRVLSKRYLFTRGPSFTPLIQDLKIAAVGGVITHYLVNKETGLSTFCSIMLNSFQHWIYHTYQNYTQWNTLINNFNNLKKLANDGLSSINAFESRCHTTEIEANTIMGDTNQDRRKNYTALACLHQYGNEYHKAACLLHTIVNSRTNPSYRSHHQDTLLTQLTALHFPHYPSSYDISSLLPRGRNLPLEIIKSHSCI